MTKVIYRAPGRTRATGQGRLGFYPVGCLFSSQNLGMSSVYTLSDQYDAMCLESMSTELRLDMWDIQKDGKDPQCYFVTGRYWCVWACSVQEQLGTVHPLEPFGGECN